MCDRDIRNCVCAGKAALPRFPLPPLLAAGMAAGYVIGCCCGANAELPDSSEPVLSFLQSGTGGALYGGLLPELCISCAYGFAFLLLSTSYLGFLLIPVVFGVKGFLSACTAAAFLRSGCAHAFALSCVAVGLPGVFLVPALFLLGVLCAQMSVRLMEQRRGLAVSCCDGALFPGTGVGVLPAACGCGHGELCRAVFHKAYSVTDGHSG